MAKKNYKSHALTSGGESVMICDFISIQYQNVTDRWLGLP